MATGNIIGKVNIPISPITYEGETTSTAKVTVDNIERTISVDVNTEEVTKDCTTKEYVAQAIEELKNGTLPIYPSNTKIKDLKCPCFGKWSDSDVGGFFLFTCKTTKNNKNYIWGYSLFYDGYIMRIAGDNSFDDDLDIYNFYDLYLPGNLMGEEPYHNNEYATKQYVDNSSTKLYRHMLNFNADSGFLIELFFITNFDTPIDNSNMASLLDGGLGYGYVTGCITDTDYMHLTVYRVSYSGDTTYPISLMVSGGNFDEDKAVAYRLDISVTSDTVVKL